MKFRPSILIFLGKQEESIYLFFPFLIVFVSSTRRDLEEVKEELREERTRRQALQVSEQQQFNRPLRSLYATDCFSFFFFFLNCPSRRKCTVWSWDIKRDTGCLTQTCAPELLTQASKDRTEQMRPSGSLVRRGTKLILHWTGETWSALLHWCAVLLNFTYRFGGAFLVPEMI